jgi:molybdopterin converting factor subunit 1
MRVTLRLFALARDRAGRPELVLDLPEAATVADLKRVLAATSPELAPLVPNLMIAVDSEYAGDDLTIIPGAEVAAIPPVSGGSPPGPPSPRIPGPRTSR